MAFENDYLHQKLGLQNDEALCCDQHLVSKDRKTEIHRITIVIILKGTQSTLFVKALDIELSRHNLYLVPALSAIDFVFFIYFCRCDPKVEAAWLSQSTCGRRP